MNEDKKTIILIILIILVIIALVVTGTILVLNMNKSDTGNNSNTTENKEINNNMSDIKENNSETDIDLNSWIGTYENGETIIKMYRSSLNNIYVEIIDNTLRNEYFAGNSENDQFDQKIILEAISKEKLYTKDEWFDTTDIIEIEKISNGIKIKASSTDENSLLNSCSGEYKLKEFEKLGWSGVYTNNENTIIISEVYEDNLCIVADSKTNNSTMTIESIEDYSKDEINYESDFFSDERKIKITKTSKGIKVEASSEDKEDMANYISGTYTKE